MIKYNLNNINDWNFGEDNIIKVYRNNAVCYYKVTSGDTPTPVQEPCFAVVDNISQYSETEFEDVYDKATEKWYKLNNLNQYEEYGVYGSGRNITYYDGKLTVDGDYEYQYTGGSWVNVGEISGSTATLPDVPFSVNYNANEYNSSTKTLLKTSGQLVNTDAVITAGTPTVHDGYLTIASGTRATIEGYSTYFNRTNSTPNLTIVSKQRTDGSNCHMFANRDSNYNWMYRPYATKLTLHGGSQTGSIAVTTQPVIESVRVDSSRVVKYNNYTNNTTSSSSSFSYGSTNSGKFAIFQGYGTTTGENFVGDFYWVYMSQTTLTDEQVQQVIDYNEGGGGQTEYPLEYVVREDPPDNLIFTSMEEAEEYECPWVGMKATIDGDKYVFSGDSQSGYEWIEQTGKTDNFTILDIGESALTSSLGDGDFIVISYRNHNNPIEPQYMMSYKNDGTYDRVNNFSGHTGSNTITDNTIIDAAVWQLEGTATANTYYIKNVESGKYWGYQDTNTRRSFYLVDDSQKSPILLDDYDGCIGLIEKIYPTISYFGGYGLNQLYGYTYQLGWLNNGSGSEADFYSTDGNALYVVYKIE